MARQSGAFSDVPEHVLQLAVGRLRVQPHRARAPATPRVHGDGDGEVPARGCYQRPEAPCDQETGPSYLDRAAIGLAYGQASLAAKSGA